MVTDLVDRNTNVNGHTDTGYLAGAGASPARTGRGLRGLGYDCLKCVRVAVDRLLIDSAEVFMVDALIGAAKVKESVTDAPGPTLSTPMGPHNVATAPQPDLGELVAFRRLLDRFPVTGLGGESAW